MHQEQQTWPVVGLRTLASWADSNLVERTPLARIEAALEAARDTLRDPARKGHGPALLCPGLAARPWHDPADFPWTALLERDSETIVREFHAVHAGQELVTHLEAPVLASTGSWTSFSFYRSGRQNVENCQRCPSTARVIASIPGAESAGLVYFSVMGPGTHVVPHFGPYNVRLRCHLGLSIPPQCGIRVGDEMRTWQEGKCLIFDDAFVHEAWNRSSILRAVLIVDVWHPDLSELEVAALAQLFRAWQRSGYQDAEPAAERDQSPTAASENP